MNITRVKEERGLSGLLLGHFPVASELFSVMYLPLPSHLFQGNH